MGNQETNKDSKTFIKSNLYGCAPSLHAEDHPIVDCDPVNPLGSDQSNCDMQGKAGVCQPQIHDSKNKDNDYPDNATALPVFPNTTILPGMAGCTQKDIVLTKNGDVSLLIEDKSIVKGNGHFELGDLSDVVAPVQDWLGYCGGDKQAGRTTCKICREGDTKCNNKTSKSKTRGTPQIC